MTLANESIDDKLPVLRKENIMLRSGKTMNIIRDTMKLFIQNEMGQVTQRRIFRVSAYRQITPSCPWYLSTREAEEELYEACEIEKHHFGIKKSGFDGLFMSGI